MNNTPYIKLFSTHKNKYAYDVNSNEIIRLSDVAFDYLHLLISNLPKEDVLVVMKSMYDEDDVIKTIQEIEDIINSGQLFSLRRCLSIDIVKNDKQWDNLLNSFIEQVTIELTTRCNLNCKYCLYPQLNSYKNDRKHTDVTWKIIKNILDFMIEKGGKLPNPYFNIDGGLNFAVGFYGGEPLLRIDLIDESVNYLNNNIGEGRKAHFTITTNGTLLNKENIEFLFNNNISVVISYDGYEKIHNQFRLFKSGEGSHDIVLGNIKLMHEIAKKLYNGEPKYAIINCVISGSFDWLDLWEYFTEIENILRSKYLHFNINFSQMEGGVDAWNRKHPSFLISYPTNYDVLLQEYKRACLSGLYNNNDIPWKYQILNMIVMKGFYFDLYNRTRRQFKEELTIKDYYHPGGTCIPGKRRPFVTTDGDIYPCERVPNTTYYNIGDYKNWIDYKKSKKIFDDFCSGCKNDCINCWALRICGMHCIKDLEENGIVSIEKRIKACNSIRNIRYNELVNMCELLEENAESLSHYDKITIS